MNWSHLQNFILSKERRISRSPEPQSWRKDDDHDYDYGHRPDSRSNRLSIRDVVKKHRSDQARTNFSSHGYGERDALSSFREEIFHDDKNYPRRYSSDNGHDNDGRRGDEKGCYRERGSRSDTWDKRRRSQSRSRSLSRERQVLYIWNRR